jgi:hypothetical protein
MSPPTDNPEAESNSTLPQDFDMALDATDGHNPFPIALHALNYWPDTEDSGPSKRAE